MRIELPVGNETISAELDLPAERFRLEEVDNAPEKSDWVSRLDDAVLGATEA